MTVRVLAALALLGRDQAWLTRVSRLGRNTIARFLQPGGAPPSERTTARIAEALGIAPAWLVPDANINRPFTAAEWEELQRGLRLLRRLVQRERIDARARPNAQRVTGHRIPRAFRLSGARTTWRVRGSSMADAGLRDGDLAFVAPQTNLRQLAGSIVLVSLNGALFLKQLRVEERGVPALHSAAPGYEPIRIEEEDDFRLVGRIVAMVRGYP